MNPWQFHFGQKLCSWYLGHLHNNGTQGGEKKTRKNRKALKKSWTLSSREYPPTSLITKNQNYVWNTKKEMNAEIKTNCEKHHLWHHCLRKNKQLKRCFGLAVHFVILDYLFLPVCATNSSTSDLLPFVLHILIGKDLFQKRYRHQKEILAKNGQIKTRWKTNTSYPRASMAVICCPIVALLRKSGNTSSSFSLCKPTTNRSFIFHGNAFWSRPVKEGQNK